MYISLTSSRGMYLIGQNIMAQRYIKDTFWTDSYIESLSPDYKLVFVYLLTNPQMNVAGVYEIREKRIAFETGYDIEVIQNILKRFEEDGKIIYQDDWIIIVNFFKHLSLGSKTAEGVNRIIEKAPISIMSHFSMENVENTKGDTYSVYVLDTPYIPHTRGMVSGVSSCKLKVSSNKLEVKKEKKEKNEFGEMGKVKLTEEEYQKLIERFGEDNVRELIFELDTYIASKGVRYKSHYATMLNWAKRKYDQAKGSNRYQVADLRKQNNEEVL